MVIISKVFRNDTRRVRQGRRSSAPGGPVEADPKPSHTQAAVIAMASFLRQRQFCQTPKPQSLHTHRRTISYSTQENTSWCSHADRQKTNAHAQLQPTWPRNRSLLGHSFQRVGRTRSLQTLWHNSNHVLHLFLKSRAAVGLGTAFWRELSS